MFLSSPASDSRQDGNRVTVGNWGLQAAEETDILVVQVDIDEPAEVLAVDQPVAQAAVLGVQVGKQLVQGGPGPLHRLGATCVAAQNRRNANLNGHERRSSVNF